MINIANYTDIYDLLRVKMQICFACVGRACFRVISDYLPESELACGSSLWLTACHHYFWSVTHLHSNALLANRNCF